MSVHSTNSKGSDRRIRPHREVSELRSFMRRMTVAVRRRAEAGDLEAVACLADVLKASRLELIQAARGANAAGHTWKDIGAALGVSAQAAQQRFGENDG